MALFQATPLSPSQNNGLIEDQGWRGVCRSARAAPHLTTYFVDGETEDLQREITWSKSHT